MKTTSDRSVLSLSRSDCAFCDQAKELLDALGIPWVQAPSEGEAQAAHMCNKGDVYACVSQDYDSLLLKTTPRVLMFLTRLK